MFLSGASCSAAGTGLRPACCRESTLGESVRASGNRRVDRRHWPVAGESGGTSPCGSNAARAHVRSVAPPGPGASRPCERERDALDTGVSRDRRRGSPQIGRTPVPERAADSAGRLIPERTVPPGRDAAGVVRPRRGELSRPPAARSRARRSSRAQGCRRHRARRAQAPRRRRRRRRGGCRRRSCRPRSARCRQAPSSVPDRRASSSRAGVETRSARSPGRWMRARGLASGLRGRARARRTNGSTEG